jgi:hypothetical protein
MKRPVTPAALSCRRYSILRRMIRKSGDQFSEKILLKQ